MNEVIIGVLGLCGLGLAVAIWVLICNQRTYRQRIRLINRRPKGADFWAYSCEFGDVSYDEHLWTLVRLGDPRKLYGPLNREIW